MSRTNNVWFRHVLFATWVAGFVATGFASAEWLPIYLDIGDTRSVPTSPGTWNALTSKDYDTSGSSIADLLDSAGNSTGIGVSVTTSFHFEGTAGGTWEGTPAWAMDAATDDNFSTSNSTGVIAFTGLIAPAYDFSVISSRAVNPDDGIRKGTFLINGASADNHIGTFSASGDGWISRKIMTWDAVVPVAGTIELEVSSVSGQYGYLSALRMVPVPEPGSIILLTALGIAVLLWRRRSRHSHPGL